MLKILINGDFFCRKLTGIERCAREITLHLDAISLKNEIAIIVPANAPPLPSFKNLFVIRLKTKIKSHFLWQMLTLQFFLLTHTEYIVLDFGNTCLPLSPGIVFLYDIYCEFFPEDFTSLRDRLGRLYYKLQYRLIAKLAKKIITVSNFSRNQITGTFRVNPEKITVVYASWNHFNTIQADYSVFKNYPALFEKKFYFSLGSLSKRKNITWIIEYAAKHPDSFFAISGTALPSVKVAALAACSLSNILLLGYLDDGKVKALMEKCKAFILPSYYEGFGLTPLEALSCGAQIIVANAASLPEIYGKAAHYIDPFDTGIDLDELLREPVEAPDALFEKYSSDKSAQKVYNIIKEITNC
jgi:glycosyltransferase involved in cell wall biosynthesis